MLQAFVSYQRADALLAAHLLGYALRAAGHAAFVDTGAIGGGQAFREAIDAAVGSSHALLALVGRGFDAARLREPANVVAFEWRRARFHQVPVVPVLVDGAALPADDALPAELRWVTRRNAFPLRPASLGPDVDALVAALPARAAPPRRAARVLWVDDHPANNERERAWLRPRGLVFDNVVSTGEALEQLANERYDLVITDLGRVGSSDRSAEAGAAFLAHPALRDGGPPVVVYAGVGALLRREALRAAGAAAVCADPDTLQAEVLRLLGRAASAVDPLPR